MENVIIIGGGPAGLSSAIYLARAGLSPLVFAGSPPGGQLTLTSEVENFPGYDSILGGDLIDKMRKQAEKFGAKIIDQNITKTILSISKKEVFTDKKNYTTKSLIIATGAKALWLDVPGEKELQGKGVSACATCDGFFFRDKIVAVVGGGDTAMEEALTLTKFAKKVYIIHRRDSFRASKIMQERVFTNKKIEVIWNTVVEEVIGNLKVEAIKFKSQNSKVKSESQKLEVDGVFVAIGHKPDTKIFDEQIELDEKGYVITTARLAMEMVKSRVKSQKSKVTIKNEKLEKIVDKFDFDYQMLTSVPGIFAAGDCVDYIYRQAATAAGMGVAAALEVERWLEEK